ncbi:SEL1-like repeat protein [Dialister sp.]|uniref:SEL1-like repeat protein n=1 Tax=Dialister sp. TaxID=1955814 RepID=UPI002E815A80|nr:tetratricopeptide repeat protein [Dialister sp.]MEE3453379.1 tetratricopeptide repeat protein [Dialister sp.]
MTNALQKAQELYLEGRYVDSFEAYLHIMEEMKGDEEEGTACIMNFYIGAAGFMGHMEDSTLMSLISRSLELESPMAAIHSVMAMEAGEDFSDLDEIVKNLRRMAEGGNIMAINLMGKIYNEGLVVEENQEESLKWLERGAALGDPVSMLDAAMVYDIPGFEGADDEKSLELLRKSVDCGYPQALYILGRDYFEGAHQDKDIRKAYELMEKAAEAGYTDAAVDMWGQFLDHEEEIEEAIPDISEKKLLSCLKQAADWGNDEALYLLGQYYSEEGDTSKAEKYLKQAMEMGNLDAQVELGGLYIFDKKSEKDHKKGISLLKEAAREGDGDALSTLGACYLQGNGVRMNRKEALKYLKKAVEVGSAEGMVLMIQVSLMDGKPEEAVKYAKMAADTGEPHGQFLLGSFYLMGDGVAKNEKTAIFYLRSAALQGVREAQDLLNRINLGLL